MNFKKIIASALSAAMVISSMALTAFADATLTLEASKSAVVRGDSFTVSLPIDAAKNVASADITLDYDENIFTCESGTTEFGDVVFNPVKDLGSGNLGAYFSINDIYAAKKSGKLFTATFKAKSDAVGGDYNFTVIVDSIKDVNGTAIDTYIVSPATVAVKAPDKLATPAVTIDRDTKKATWANVTNAADYNVVLTKGTEELYNNNQGAAATGDNTFEFAKYVTETADYTVTVTANQNGSMYLASDAGTATENYVVDAVISITTKDYVLGSDGFDVVITPNGNVFNGITGLTAASDYTENGNVIHINESYLATITGTKELVFAFATGTSPKLTVNVTPAATGATFILAERAVAADSKYFTDAKQDIDTNANDGTTEGLIVVSDPEAPVTNLLGTQFTISNNADVGYDSVDYEIVPADGFALLYDEATGLYEINVKPVDGVRPAMSEAAAGKGIVIGKLIYKGGYGKGTIKAENIRLTVEKSDNTYKEIDATNAGFEFKYDIPEPSADLKVNVNLGRHYTKVDNAKAYQNMKLRVYSARLGFIDFDLGTDSVAYDEKNGTLQTTGKVEYDADAKTYTLTLENLPAFDKYTVFVSGDGYRDAKAQFDLNENTTVDFWSNANDSEIAQVTKIGSGIVKTAKKNFLAGDIIMNGVIDLYDLSAVSSYYGKSNLTAGDKDYIQYDLNRDGKVDLDDISILLAGWAE